MKIKRKLLISMVAIVFILLATVATIAVIFAMSQQTIKTTLNIKYIVNDIDGNVSATYTIGEQTENLTAVKSDGTIMGNTLFFKAADTQDAGNFIFPEDPVSLNKDNDNIVIKYTYTNTGDKHYVATMSFDAELKYENMNVEYGIEDLNTGEIKYSSSRYALVVPSEKSLSYWIRISIKEKSKSASFVGDFDWYLEGSDKNTLGYEVLESLEFTGSDGEYSAAFNGNVDALQNGMLIFPSEVNGDPVTSIVENDSLSEEQKQAVTSVYIPDNVTIISDNAFNYYTNLEKVDFEQNKSVGTLSVQNNSGLVTVGMDAFSGCYSLNDIILPNTVTEIWDYAFDGCVSLRTFNIPDKVTYIGEGAFTYSGLIEVEIPNGVEEIRNYTFQYCEDLTTFKMGAGVSSFGMGALEGCCTLTSIIVAEENATYHSDGNCLIETQRKELVAGSINSVIPTDGSVETIKECAFSEIGIKTLVIPSSVNWIEPYAFSCFNLTDLIFEGYVTVQTYAFYSPSLINLTISGTIWDYAFMCENLTNLTIEDAELYKEAFYDCPNIKNLTIGSDVKWFYPFAFGECENLESVVFENTSNWYVTDEFDPHDPSGEYYYGEITPISSTDLSDPATAAIQIANYKDKYWFVMQ